MFKMFKANCCNERRGLRGNNAVFVEVEAITWKGNWIGPELTGDKLDCDSGCALFTLPAHGSCLECLIVGIEWLQKNTRLGRKTGHGGIKMSFL